MVRVQTNRSNVSAWWIPLTFLAASSCSQVGQNASFRQSDDSQINDDQNDQELGSAQGDQNGDNRSGMAPNPLAGMNLVIESQSYSGVMFHVVIAAKGDNLGKIDWKAIPLNLAKLDCVPSGISHLNCSVAPDFNVTGSGGSIKSVPIEFTVSASSGSGKKASLRVLLATIYNLGKSPTIASDNPLSATMQEPVASRAYGSVIQGNKLKLLFSGGEILTANLLTPDISYNVPDSSPVDGTYSAGDYSDLRNPLVSYQYQPIDLFDSSLSLGNSSSNIGRISWMNWILGAGNAIGESTLLQGTNAYQTVWRQIVPGTEFIAEIIKRDVFELRIYSIYDKAYQADLNGTSHIVFPNASDISQWLPRLDTSTSNRPQLQGMFAKGNKVYLTLTTQSKAYKLLSCSVSPSATTCTSVLDIPANNALTGIRGFQPSMIPDAVQNDDFKVIYHGGVRGSIIAAGIKLVSSPVLGILTKKGDQFSFVEVTNSSPRSSYGNMVSGVANDKSLILFGGEAMDYLYSGQGIGEMQALELAGKLTKNARDNSLYRVSPNLPFLSVISLDGSQNQINIKVPSKEPSFDSQKLEAVPVTGSLGYVLDFVSVNAVAAPSGANIVFSRRDEVLLICPSPGEGITCQKKASN